MATCQQRTLRELLRVQEVHLAWIETRFDEGRFDMNKIRVGELLGSLPKPVECLLVQTRIVGEPEHYRATIRIEVERVVAPEQRLDRRRGHDCLSCAGGGRQRKR